MAIRRFAGEYRFLSNFFPVVIPLDGLNYGSVEHAYQAAKTLDLGARQRIQTARSATRAKALGQRLELRPYWDDIKEGIMLDLLRRKFQYPALRSLLIMTGEEELVEGNGWGDTYWGVCRGIGQNRLGKLLIQVRGEIASRD